MKIKSQIMWHFLVTLSILSSTGWAANILYINGFPSSSHFIWHRALIYELAAKGHNVTAVSVDVEDNPPANVTFIHIEGLYEGFAKLDPGVNDVSRLTGVSPFIMLKNFNVFSIVACSMALQTKGFRLLLDYPDVFKVDLIITDYQQGPCMTAIVQHKFGRPPLVGVTNYHGFTTTTPMTGAYSYSSVIPNHVFDAPEIMSYSQRFMNFLYNHWEELLKVYQWTPAIDGMVRQLVPDIPYVDEFVKETRIVLLNSHPVIQYPESSMPNVISVGGMQIGAQKELPDNLRTIVEGAKNGAIFFSLGSYVRSDLLGKARIAEILNAMERLPQYQFLWKFESDSMPVEVPSNVYIHKWMPQSDLLAHPNVKLFITHGGLLSTQETIWYGVPVIGFPVYADQNKNVNYCVEQGAGKRLSIVDINSNDLVKAIHEVMTDESYQHNMTRLSKLFRDQPEHPLERAVWWVEWVLRNPNTMILRSRAVELNWLVKYSFDVIVPLVVIIAFASFVVLKIVRILWCRDSQKVKSKRE